MKTPDYQHMLDSLKPLLAGPPDLVHCEFNNLDHLAQATFAPVTEMATLYLPEESPPFYNNLGSFAEILTKQARGCLGVAYGCSIEHVQDMSLGKGVKGKAYLLAIGWQSIEAHVLFKKTHAFKRCLELLKEARGSEIHHVKFQGN
jgi:quinol monooxygenase YgiN